MQSRPLDMSVFPRLRTCAGLVVFASVDVFRFYGIWRWDISYRQGLAIAVAASNVLHGLMEFGFFLVVLVVWQGDTARMVQRG